MLDSCLCSGADDSIASALVFSYYMLFFFCGMTSSLFDDVVATT